jgi:hypothetical protein
LIFVAALLVLAGFGLAYWAVVNAFRTPGKAMAALAGAFMLTGAAVGVLTRLGL